MVNCEITKEKITIYLKKTEAALAKIKIAAPDRSHSKKIAEDFLNMANFAMFSDIWHGKF